MIRNVTFVAGRPLSTRQRSITFEMSDGLAVESHPYKVVGGRSLSLGVVNPDGWTPADRRPAMLFVAATWTVQGKHWWNERMAYFASRGIVAIRATIRTVPPDSTVAPDSPANDVNSAMRWVRAHAGELGIDPNRIGVVGSSAGGQLAAVAAMINGLNDPQDDLSVSAKANALLMLNGIVDTGPQGWGYDRVGDRYRQFSPTENVSPDDPPTFAVYGTSDRVVPQATVQQFQGRLTAVGVRNDILFWSDQVHGFMNLHKHNGRYYYETWVAADRFLASLAWIRGAPSMYRPAAYRVAAGAGPPWFAGMKQVRVE